jgi:hypothetical protein
MEATTKAIVLCVACLFVGSAKDSWGAAQCQPDKDHRQVIENFNKITEGFNNKDWSLIEPRVDNDISLTRLERNGKTHKKSKADYKKHLEDDAWKKDPNWDKVECDTPSDIMSGLIKLVVTYQFTFTQNGQKNIGPAFAVMLFKHDDGKLVDFTVGSLSK